MGAHLGTGIWALPKTSVRLVPSTLAPLPRQGQVGQELPGCTIPEP